MSDQQRLQIRVEYYALLREQRGCEGESLETAAATTGELYEELQTRHGFSLPEESLKVAVNEAMSTWDTALKDGDTVVFIPPVAGG